MTSAGWTGKSISTRGPITDYRLPTLDTITDLPLVCALQPQRLRAAVRVDRGAARVRLRASRVGGQAPGGRYGMESRLDRRRHGGGAQRGDGVQPAGRRQL